MNDSQHDLWLIVTTMGRLAHLKLTVPLVLQQERVTLCLVDYSCPEGSGAWIEWAYQQDVDAGRVRVVRCAGERIFHKTRALNLGARHAIEQGAHRLCFADADTIFDPGSLAAIEQRLTPDRFLIAGRVGDRDCRSLTGLLAVEGRDFEASGGYDETFVGWGSEDIAMRLRLYLCCKLMPVRLPAGLVRAVPHSNRTRVRFAPSSDLYAQASENQARLEALVEEWTGGTLNQLPAVAQDLLFRG